MLCVLVGYIPYGRRFRGELYSVMEFEGRTVEWFTKRISAQQHSGLYGQTLELCASLADCLFIASSLNTLREKGGSPTRKLIGHSGPVYSLAFDPVAGSAAPPKYLLSGSADATVRLWSMDTMTNVVAYRGHQNPVWDVDWSPMGIYFTTASRDRTARLWSTDRTSTLRIYAGHSSDVDVSPRKGCRLSETHLK
jgi:WD40 repeat protein